ncbi:hypothetical protein GF342_00945 [Candidatus Woesearchaeota archaeon]|nr:hypothetical protein [Candidatus Woesearchaeota archaeon]
MEKLQRRTWTSTTTGGRIMGRRRSKNRKQKSMPPLTPARAESRIIEPQDGYYLIQPGGTGFLDSIAHMHATPADALREYVSNSMRHGRARLIQLIIHYGRQVNIEDHVPLLPEGVLTPRLTDADGTEIPFFDNLKGRMDIVIKDDGIGIPFSAETVEGPYGMGLVQLATQVASCQRQLLEHQRDTPLQRVAGRGNGMVGYLRFGAWSHVVSKTTDQEYWGVCDMVRGARDFHVYRLTDPGDIARQEKKIGGRDHGTSISITNIWDGDRLRVRDVSEVVERYFRRAIIDNQVQVEIIGRQGRRTVGEATLTPETVAYGREGQTGMEEPITFEANGVRETLVAWYSERAESADDLTLCMEGFHPCFLRDIKRLRGTIYANPHLSGYVTCTSLPMNAGRTGISRENRRRLEAYMNALLSERVMGRLEAWHRSVRQPRSRRGVQTIVQDTGTSVAARAADIMEPQAESAFSRAIADAHTDVSSVPSGMSCEIYVSQLEKAQERCRTMISGLRHGLSYDEGNVDLPEASAEWMEGLDMWRFTINQDHPQRPMRNGRENRAYSLDLMAWDISHLLNAMIDRVQELVPPGSSIERGLRRNLTYPLVYEILHQNT